MDSQASSQTATVPRMAEKGWTARVAAAAGAAAGTGAAQLGLGYGLGVVVWPVTETPDESVWLGSLGWATWIAASATVFGAVIASRLGGGPAAGSRGPWRLALATSAAAGALVAVALIALPARSAVRADTFSPQVIAGGYAAIGLAIGLLVAYWAVVSRPVAANLITTAAWLWALAISAIVVELTMHRRSATYLTSWQFAEPATGHRYGTIFWPGAALTLAAAFLIGALSVIPAARRGNLGLGAATSGAIGPLLVAAAFFALAPQLTGALGPLESAYLIAPYAVLAGLAGSALTVAVAQAAVNRQARKAARRSAAPEASGVADVPAAEPAGASELTASATGPAPEVPAHTKPAPSAGRSSLDDVTPATSGSSSVANPSSPPVANPSARSGANPSSPPVANPSARSGAVAPAPRKPAAGSTSSAPAVATDPVRPWESSPGAKPPQPGSPIPAGSGVPQAKPDRSGKSEPLPGQPKASPAQPSGSARTGQAAARAGAAAGAEPDADFDSEIAAAARPRGRAKKAAPPPTLPENADKSSKSTVTPPPATPTIAQINPKPQQTG